MQSTYDSAGMTRRAQVPECIQKTVLKTTCKCPLTMLWDLQALISNNIHGINVMTIIYNYSRLYCTAQANAHLSRWDLQSAIHFSIHFATRFKKSKDDMVDVSREARLGVQIKFI